MNVTVVEFANVTICKEGDIFCELKMINMHRVSSLHKDLKKTCLYPLIQHGHFTYYVLIVVD